MNKTILILSIFFTTSFASAAERLSCEFNLFQAPFFFTSSELNEDRSLGEYSLANYSGSAQKSVRNKKVQLVENQIYSFELDEGNSSSNIRVKVFEDMTGVVINPQTQIGGDANGICKFEKIGE